MTDEEIEKALNDLTVIDLSDESNYDSCCRLVPPRGMMAIKDALDYINRLKAEIAELKELLDVANNREWRKKFISEVWKKELGNELSTPDADFVYKLYFDQREQLYQTEQRLAECEVGYQGKLFLEHCMVNDAVEKAKKDTAKDILTALYVLCKERDEIQWDDIYFLVLRYKVEVDDE